MRMLYLNVANVIIRQYWLKGNLKAHVQSKHENVRFGCSQCEYKARTKGSLKAHIQAKHENARFECGVDNNLSTPP